MPKLLRKIGEVFFLASAIFLFLTKTAVASPYLINSHGDGSTMSVSTILQNIEYVESMPFDGLAITSSVTWELMDGYSISYNTISSQLSPLKNAFTKFRHNFILITTDDPGDLFDNNAWSTTIQNWQNLARVIKEVGLVGIIFDNEEYSGHWDNYPEDYSNPQHSLQEYQDQARLLGKQIMEAIVKEFPEIKVLVYHGPYLSECKTPYNDVIKDQADNCNAYELLGPFFVGFVEEMGSQATVIDGGEVYQYRTVSDFEKSYQWRKYDMASAATNCPFIPTSLRSQWPSKVTVDFGVYNSSWILPMSPTTMRSTLENALRRCDEYVWFYTEGANWVRPGGISQEWINAVREAKEAVGSPIPSPTPTPKLTPTPTPSNPYDLSGDGQVNAADILILLENWRDGSQGDFNSDGKMNGMDFGMLIAHWTSY